MGVSVISDNRDNHFVEPCSLGKVPDQSAVAGRLSGGNKLLADVGAARRRNGCSTSLCTTRASRLCTPPQASRLCTPPRASRRLGTAQFKVEIHPAITGQQGSTGCAARHQPSTCSREPILHLISSLRRYCAIARN